MNPDAAMEQAAALLDEAATRAGVSLTPKSREALIASYGARLAGVAPIRTDAEESSVRSDAAAMFGDVPFWLNEAPSRALRVLGDPGTPIDLGHERDRRRAREVGAPGHGGDAPAE